MILELVLLEINLFPMMCLNRSGTSIEWDRIEVVSIIANEIRIEHRIHARIQTGWHFRNYRSRLDWNVKQNACTHTSIA